MQKGLDEIRIALFSVLEPHAELIYLNNAEYVRLIGEYASLYQYASELYVHCISLVRSYSEQKELHLKAQAMDRRDMVEQYLKAIKFQYDALSRKVTVITNEAESL